MAEMICSFKLSLVGFKGNLSLDIFSFSRGLNYCPKRQNGSDTLWVLGLLLNWQVPSQPFHMEPEKESGPLKGTTVQTRTTRTSGSM